MVVIASEKQPPNEAEDKTRVGKMAQGQAEMFISQKCSFLKCWKCPKPTTESLEKTPPEWGRVQKSKQNKVSREKEKKQRLRDRENTHEY